MNTLRRYRVSLGGLMAALVALWQITQPLSMTAATIIKADNNTNIDQGSSWTGGVVPNSIDIASFDGTLVTTGSGTLVMATDLDFAGLLVTNPSEAITIGGVGRTLTLTGLGGVANVINLGGATQDLSLNMDILRLLGATQTWNVASGRTLSIGAGLRGTTNVTLSGAGTVELTGNSIATTIAGLPTNLYTGSLTVSSGVTLVAKNSNALGGNVITGGNTTVASGGSLTFDATGGPIVNLEALSLTGTGVGNNGALRHIAGTTILNGQITLTGSVEIQADAGYLEINQAETGPNAGASSIVSTAISPTVTYDVASGARIRQAGVVATPTTSGTLNVVKNGDGILQLDGANTFTGGVQLNAGTLRIGNASGLGTAASGLTIANGTTLSMSDGVSRTLLNGITVNGDFTLGETTVGTGALTLSGTVALGAANRTITVVRGSNGIVAQNISGIISATGAFGIVQAGNGFLNLSGASTFSGGYTIGTGATTLFG
ncbi:MAG: beta strand repeat-containing protein, partial [Roseimicrobium sp.]